MEEERTFIYTRDCEVEPRDLFEKFGLNQQKKKKSEPIEFLLQRKNKKIKNMA